MSAVGEVSLWVALLMAAWATLSSFVSARGRRPELSASGARALSATFVLLSLATGALLFALLSGDFSLAYVVRFTSSNLPASYRVAALWAGDSGSLLLMTLFLSACTAVVARRAPAAVLAALLLFFMAVLCFALNPFERLDFTASEGLGLLPRLQAPSMLLHPPLLLLGYVMSAVPFARSTTDALTGASRRSPSDSTIVWAWISWCLVAAGILSGLWWSYLETGATDSWAMDPVSNYSLPALMLTSALLCGGARVGSFKVQRGATVLAAASFLACLVGLVHLRSGVFSSPATQPDRLGIALLVLIVLVTAFSTWVVLRPSAAGERGESTPRDFELSTAFAWKASLAGGAILLLTTNGLPAVLSWMSGGQQGAAQVPRANVWIYTGLATLFLILIVSEQLRAGGAVVGRSTFTRLIAPVAAAVATAAFLRTAEVGVVSVVLLMSLGVSTVTLLVQEALRRAVTPRAAKGPLQEGIQNIGTRGADYTALWLRHLGIVLIVFGLTGTTLRTVHNLEVSAGTTVVVADPLGRRWTFTNLGASTFEELNSHVVEVAFASTVNGETLPIIKSAMRQHFDRMGNPTHATTGKSAIVSGPKQDLYLKVLALSADQVASIRIVYSPLVLWIWIGGAVLLLGALLPAFRPITEPGS